MATSTGRFQPNQQFSLPDGRKVLVASADSINTLRKQYSNSTDAPELVVRGSTEHRAFLQEAQQHHEGRRTELRERHGHVYHEWEDVHNQLNAVSMQLAQLSRTNSGLHHNYGKFGYDEGVKTYDDEEMENQLEHGASGAHDGGPSCESEKQEFTIKLAKIPVVKQWFHRGTLWRASEQTEIMAIELFFDLVYGKSSYALYHI